MRTTKSALILLIAALNLHQLHAQEVSTRKPRNQEASYQFTVAVFEGTGVGKSRLQLVKSIQSSKRIATRPIDVDAIVGGKLKGFDAVIFPGGSGSKQGRTLGESGREAVREYVKDGGAYLGFCAGAYLATADYDWSLHLLDAKVLDRKHWARGTGTVKIGLSLRGARLLGVQAETVDIYYGQGPLLAPAGKDSIPDFVSLARYETEIAKKGAPKGVMRGTTAIAAGQFGKGRVFCFSPHPEKTKGLDDFVHRAIKWTVNRSQDPELFKMPRIGFSVPSTRIPFFKEIVAGAREAEAKLGVELIVLDANLQSAQQKEHLNELLLEEYDAIAISPFDEPSLSKLIKDVHAAQVPLFTADIPFIQEDHEVAGHVESDNTKAGRLAAEVFIKELGDQGGDIAILGFDSARACKQRVSGFQEVIKKHNNNRRDSVKEIRIVKKLSGVPTVENGFKLGGQLLPQFPNMKGIFCVNDPLALGLAKVVATANKQDQIVIVSIDGSIVGRKAVDDGRIHATISHETKEIGRQLVRTIAHHLIGRKTKPQILISPTVYDGHDETR